MSDASKSATSLILVILAIAVAAGLSTLLIMQPEPVRQSSTGLPQGMSGVVLSSGAINLSKVNGGTREMATVRLNTGETVSALVAMGGPLSQGDHVTLVPAIRAGVGLPPYDIISKAPR
jgi:hypothetical protein